MTSAVALLGVSLALGGCGIAQVALERSREADAGNINLTKTSNYDSSAVADYGTVLVLASEAGANGGPNIFGTVPSWSGTTATGGASADILSSRLVTELSRLGYEVLEKGDIEQLATDEQLERGTERTARELARKAGADAMIVAVAQQGTATKFGFFGVGAGMETGVVSASVKLIDIGSGKSMALISSDYPEPRNATEVVDGLVPYIGQAFDKQTETTAAAGV